MKKKIIISLTLVIVIVTTVFSIFTDNKSIVSYKTYKDGNNSSQMLRKILADNTLQQEKENMFNYASNGSYIASLTEEGPQYGSEPSQITNGLFSMEDEDGTSYYFRGNVTNNNVQFGTYEEDYYVYGNEGFYYQSSESCKEDNVGYEDECTQVKLASKGDKMYWKIIRVNGDGSLRLIYNGTSITHSYSDLTNSYAIGIVPYNLNTGDPKYTGYTYDNGTDSFVKKEVDTWYKNTLGTNNNYDSKISLGRFCSDSSGYKPASEYGFSGMDGLNVFASYDRLGQAYNNFTKPNNPSLKCSSTSESYGGSYRLKAGLITADEMALAGESFYVSGNSYLGVIQMTRLIINPCDFWTMTPMAYRNTSGYVLDQNSTLVWTYNMLLVNNDLSLFNGVRPVINLDKNTVIKGTGTEDDPYVVTEPTKYEGVITIEEGSSSNKEDAFDNVTIPSDVTWTSQDDSISRIENGKILGLKEGTTTITGVSSDGLTTYEIKVTVIKNPITMSSIYIVIVMLLILILGTTIVLYYKKKFRDL